MDKDAATPESLEQALIARASRGEAEAFGVLVARYEARLFNFMVRYTGDRDAARDLCQEAFLKSFRALPGFRVGAPFKPWLYRVAINTANSWLRRGARREVGVDALPDAGSPLRSSTAQQPPPTDTHLERNQRSDAVAAALARLPADQREAVVLRFVEDFSYEEMAVVLGTRVPAVKMRVHRGLARLRELLQGHGGPP
ncbi:MAG: sigma-70 family RNA polymerase sigma factor [Deltaproteobacteria bacterium]|nr:sigma-70 family RNA polymerase sigma factor [Deltaproteobacteria bacterium]